MRSTFKLLFYINRRKIKKNGRCPIMGRVTLDGKISQYSTGLEMSLTYGMQKWARHSRTAVRPETSPAKKEMS